MTKPGDIKRAQQAMRTERLRLKEDRLLLEREQRRLDAERDELRREVADLQVELAWAREENARLVGEVERARADAARAAAGQRAAERDPERRPAPGPTPSPAPLRPTALPPIEHRIIPVRAEQGRELGWRASCTCGWRSSFERTEAQALQVGAIHTDRMVAARSSRRA